MAAEIKNPKAAGPAAAADSHSPVDQILRHFDPWSWFQTFPGLKNNLKAVADNFVTAAADYGTDESAMVTSLHSFDMISRFVVEDLVNYFGEKFELDEWDLAALRYHLNQPVNDILKAYFTTCVESDSRLQGDPDYAGYFAQSASARNPDDLIRQIISNELNDFGDNTARRLCETLFERGNRCIENRNGAWVARLPGLDVSDFSSLTDGLVPDFSKHPYLCGAMIVGGILLAVFCPPAAAWLAIVGGSVGVAGGLAQATVATVDSYSTGDDVQKKMAQVRTGQGLGAAGLGALAIYGGAGALASAEAGIGGAGGGSGVTETLPAVKTVATELKPPVMQPPKALPGPVASSAAPKPPASAKLSVTAKPQAVGSESPQGAGLRYSYPSDHNEGEILQAELVPSETAASTDTLTATQDPTPDWWWESCWPGEADASLVPVGSSTAVQPGSAAQVPGSLGLSDQDLMALANWLYPVPIEVDDDDTELDAIQPVPISSQGGGDLVGAAVYATSGSDTRSANKETPPVWQMSGEKSPPSDSHSGVHNPYAPPRAALEASDYRAGDYVFIDGHPAVVFGRTKTGQILIGVLDRIPSTAEDHNYLMKAVRITNPDDIARQLNSGQGFIIRVMFGDEVESLFAPRYDYDVITPYEIIGPAFRIGETVQNADGQTFIFEGYYEGMEEAVLKPSYWTRIKAYVGFGDEVTHSDPGNSFIPPGTVMQPVNTLRRVR